MIIPRNRSSRIGLSHYERPPLLAKTRVAPTGHERGPSVLVACSHAPLSRCRIGVMIDPVSRAGNKCHPLKRNKSAHASACYCRSRPPAVLVCGPGNAGVARIATWRAFTIRSVILEHGQRRSRLSFLPWYMHWPLPAPYGRRDRIAELQPGRQIADGNATAKIPLADNHAAERARRYFEEE